MGWDFRVTSPRLTSWTCALIFSTAASNLAAAEWTYCIKLLISCKCKQENLLKRSCRWGITWTMSILWALEVCQATPRQNPAHTTHMFKKIGRTNARRAVAFSSQDAETLTAFRILVCRPWPVKFLESSTGTLASGNEKCRWSKHHYHQHGCNFGLTIANLHVLKSLLGAIRSFCLFIFADQIASSGRIKSARRNCSNWTLTKVFSLEAWTIVRFRSKSCKAHPLLSLELVLEPHSGGKSCCRWHNAKNAWR